MKKIIMVVVLLALSLVGCNDKVAEVPVDDAVPVRVAMTQIDLVEEAYVTIGEVVAENSLDLMIPSGSRIESLWVVPGQNVAVGEELLTYSWNGDLVTLMSTRQGIVSKVYVSQGSVANGPILRLVDENNKLVKTMLSSELKKQLAIGDVVQVIFNDENSSYGEIVQLVQEADPFSRLFETHIRIDDTNVEFGEFVSIRFVTESREAVLVPAKAIVRKNGEKYIYQYVDDELKKVSVETGLSKGEWIELSNIPPMNFEFIIAGQNFIADEESFVVVD